MTLIDKICCLKDFINTICQLYNVSETTGSVPFSVSCPATARTMCMGKQLSTPSIHLIFLYYCIVNLGFTGIHDFY